MEVDRACDYAIYILAGMCAEEREFGAGWTHGGGCDVLQVHKIAGDFFEGAPQTTWPREMLEKAGIAVANEWNAIKEVAASLLERNVTHADVSAARS